MTARAGISPVIAKVEIQKRSHGEATLASSSCLLASFSLRILDYSVGRNVNS